MMNMTDHSSVLFCIFLRTPATSGVFIFTDPDYTGAGFESGKMNLSGLAYYLPPERYSHSLPLK